MTDNKDSKTNTLAPADKKEHTFAANVYNSPQVSAIYGPKSGLATQKRAKLQVRHTSGTNDQKGSSSASSSSSNQGPSSTTNAGGVSTDSSRQVRGHTCDVSAGSSPDGGREAWPSATSAGSEATRRSDGGGFQLPAALIEQNGQGFEGERITQGADAESHALLGASKLSAASSGAPRTPGSLKKVLPPPINTNPYDTTNALSLERAAEASSVNSTPNASFEEGTPKNAGELDHDRFAKHGGLDGGRLAAKLEQAQREANNDKVTPEGREKRNSEPKNTISTLDALKATPGSHKKDKGPLSKKYHALFSGNSFSTGKAKSNETGQGNYFGNRNLQVENRLAQESMVQGMMNEASNLKDAVNSLIKPFVIGVCGATCSGKTTLCDIFRRELKNYMRVAFVPSDSYYKDLSDKMRSLAYNSQYDFDHPDAIAWDELLTDLKTLKTGYQPITIPKYDFTTHSRVVVDSPDGKQGSTSGGEVIQPADVIIVEGILVYAVGPELRQEMDMKIFIDCDSDVRLARRLQRDIEERGRDFQGVMKQYMKFVKPSYENFVEPSKRFADVIIPNTKEDEMEKNNAIIMMVQHIKHQLEKRNCARKLTRGIE